MINETILNHQEIFYRISIKEIITFLCSLVLLSWLLPIYQISTNTYLGIPLLFVDRVPEAWVFEVMHRSVFSRCPKIIQFWVQPDQTLLFSYTQALSIFLFEEKRLHRPAGVYLKSVLGSVSTYLVKAIRMKYGYTLAFFPQ